MHKVESGWVADLIKSTLADLKKKNKTKGIHKTQSQDFFWKLSIRIFGLGQGGKDQSFSNQLYRDDWT